MNIREIFYELINEAVAAKVVFDDLEWPISFNTVIYENEKRKVNLFNDNNMATLVIKNEELFFNKLEEYIKCISSTYPYQVDEFLTVIVDKGKILNNKLLSEVENAATK